MIKAGFHLPNFIKHFFQPGSALVSKIKANLELYGERRRTLKFKVEKQISFDLYCPYERCLAVAKAHSFSQSRRNWNYVCQQYQSICDNKRQKLPFASFLKAYYEEHQRNSKNTQRRLHAIPAHFWPLHGVTGLQLIPLPPVVVA